MRATLRLLLTAACVASLVDSMQELGQCSTATFGEQGNSSPRRIEPVLVDLSNKTDMTMNLENLIPDGCKVIATVVVLCGAKSMTLTDALTVVIQVDTKYAMSSGVLFGIVYCMPDDI